MKDATGGGDAATTTAPEPAPVAPSTTDAPAAGAQPTAPADTQVSGGGAADGGGTCYEPAPEPVQCGQWVPAPVVVGGPQPTTAPTAPTSGPDTPPAPIAGPADAPAPSGQTGALVNAGMLPTWPEWQQHFTRLGLGQDEVAKLSQAALNDQQLAAVYEKIHGQVVASGGVPGETPIPGSTPASAWDAEWEQRFAALDLPVEFVAELKAEAMRRGSTDAQIAGVYDKVVANIQQAQQSQGTTAPQGTTGPQGTQQPQQPATEQPGWNAQVEQAFRSLGMPDEVIQLYAQSGAPIAGLEAAYNHAAARVQDFTDRGWMQKFTDAGIEPLDTWGQILGDQPATDEALEQLLTAHKKGQQSIWQKGGQLATSLFPGGRLLQYVFGKEAVTGEKIDRTSPMEIGMAALSGLAAFAAIRGGKNVMAGIKARNGGFAALNGVNDTLVGLGLPKGGVDAMEQAAMGATQTWGTKQKILSFIPGTALHKEVVGLGHAEAAAAAFNAGGAAKVLANDADGALQLATLTQLFDDVKSGAVRVHGGKYAYLGPFKTGPMMSLTTGKDGVEVINVAKNLKLGGNGNAQLIGMMEMGGTKLGNNPEWLANANNLIDDIADLAKADKETLGKVMAGNLASEVGSIGKPGMRPTSYIKTLKTGANQQWYTNLAEATKLQWPGSQMPRELFEVHTTQRLFSGVLDEAGAALATIDRSGLSDDAIKLLDETVESGTALRGQLDSIKAGGAFTPEYGEAFGKWNQSIMKLADAEEGVARQIFPNLFDEGGFQALKQQARHSVRVDWAATVAAGGADDVLKAAAQGADDAAAAAAAVANGGAAAPAAAADAAAGAAAASTAGTAPIADIDLDAIRALNAQRPVNQPVALSVNAAGEAVTPTGFVVPSYASPVSGPIAVGTMDDAAKLSEAIERLKVGPIG